MGKIFKKVVSVAKIGAGLYTGDYKMALSGAGDLAGGGGGSDTSTQQGNVANGAYYDPFGPSRGMYAAKLNTLMNDPAEAERMVKSSIPYTAGMASGERTLRAGLARTGQTQSGAEQLAYGNLGQDFFTKSYQDLYNQYSTLSGATQAPLSMASANQLGYQQNNLNNQALAQSIGAVGDIFRSSSSNSNINSNPVGYASGANTYTPTDQTGYMPGFGTPNVSDTSVYSPQQQAGGYMTGWASS